MLNLPTKIEPLPLADLFRSAMREFVGTVSVITVGEGAQRSGLVATSVVSLSLDPPMVLACINRSGSSWPLFGRFRHFGINTLRPDHQALADRFAGRGGVKGCARYDVGEWTTAVTGAPLLADGVVALDCELDEAIEKASHGIIIGRVRAVRTQPLESPLVYWRGTYRTISG
jgi:flavin reductase (DIM6/NTAB) family NADH-FMN oxidoreductase RutF